MNFSIRNDCKAVLTPGKNDQYLLFDQIFQNNKPLRLLVNDLANIENEDKKGSLQYNKMVYEVFVNLSTKKNKLKKVEKKFLAIVLIL